MMVIMNKLNKKLSNTIILEQRLFGTGKLLQLFGMMMVIVVILILLSVI